MSSPFRLLRREDFFPNPSLPLAVFRASNQTTGRHGHDFLELVLVDRGRAWHAHYSVDSDVPHCYGLSANDVFFVPRGWSHAYEDAEDFHIYNVLYTEELLAAAFPHSPQQPDLDLLSGRATTTSGGLVHKVHLRSGEREVIETCLREVIRESTARRAGFEAMAQAKLTEALVLVARIAASRSEDRTAVAMLEANSPVTQAARYMEENFTHPVSLEEIARAAHLSPHYFCEVFKSAMGTSAGQYLAQLRLDHAKFLLTTTQLPVTEIAFQSGFTDSSYFARVFKSTVGLTPREFRAKSE